jgi:hypothetical protein
LAGRRCPDDKLVAEIKAVIAELPTYGYRRVHAILKRQALAVSFSNTPLVNWLAANDEIPDVQLEPLLSRGVGNASWRGTRLMPRAR